jgi:hypothetical protein
MSYYQQGGYPPQQVVGGGPIPPHNSAAPPQQQQPAPQATSGPREYRQEWIEYIRYIGFDTARKVCPEQLQYLFPNEAQQGAGAPPPQQQAYQPQQPAPYQQQGVPQQAYRPY